MDFEEAVNYYHSLERFGIRPGLDSIRALCRQLGDPQKKTTLRTCGWNKR